MVYLIPNMDRNHGEMDESMCSLKDLQCDNQPSRTSHVLMMPYGFPIYMKLGIPYICIVPLRIAYTSMIP